MHALQCVATLKCVMCVWTVCEHFTLLLVLCCDFDSGEWVTCIYTLLTFPLPFQ